MRWYNKWCTHKALKWYAISADDILILISSTGKTVYGIIDPNIIKLWLWRGQPGLQCINIGSLYLHLCASIICMFAISMLTVWPLWSAGSHSTSNHNSQAMFLLWLQSKCPCDFRSALMNIHRMLILFILSVLFWVLA